MILPLRILPLATLALAVAATTTCTDAPAPPPPPIPPETLAAEHEEWRTGRRNSLANPEGGVVSWIGLWELAEGSNWFGSDRTLAIVLPAEESPPLAGKLDLAEGRVRLDSRGRLWNRRARRGPGDRTDRP